MSAVERARKSMERASSDSQLMKRTVVWNNDERDVDDMEIFYKPRTLTIFVLGLAIMFYFGYQMRDTETPEVNIKTGLAAAAAAFLLFSVLQLPNGTFYRPHPALWRLVLGWSVLYTLLLVFAFFQTVEAGRQWLRYVDEDLGVPELERAYAEHCEVFVYDEASQSWGMPYVRAALFDIFVIAHFLGWFMKSLIIRDVFLCLVLSCSWELMELTFIAMLPNFAECWWDQLILDFVLCNGLGMFLGLKAAAYFEMKTYNWSGVKTIRSFRGRIRRVALQFTPREWTSVDWGVFSSPRRLMGVLALCGCITIVELNAFFIKNILWIPTSHYLNSIRLGTWFLMGMPALREYYYYSTDPNRKKLGTQAFVALAAMSMELAICVKFGRGKFTSWPPAWALALWVAGICALFAWATYHWQGYAPRPPRTSLARTNA